MSVKDKVIEMARDGRSYHEICAALFITNKRVSEILRKYAPELTASNTRIDRNSAIKESLRQKSYRRVANDYGLSIRQVMRINQ